MWKKISLFGFAIIASGLALAPTAKAGEEMLVPEESPAPRYNYSPPARVYYSRPIIEIYPAFGYAAVPYGVYGYHRPYYTHHRFYGGHHYSAGAHRGYARRGYGRAYRR